MLTIFTTPKPFDDPHIDVIQRNAIGSWLALDPRPEIFMICNGVADGVADVAHDLSTCIELVFIDNDHLGMPFARNVFKAGVELSCTDIVAFVNTDIILFDNFISTIQQADNDADDYMLAGRRRDFSQETLIDFTDPGWHDKVRAQVMHGHLHSVAGLDYFVFRREHWYDFPEMPDLLIAGTCYDNWILWAGMESGVVFDTTKSILAGHQQHGYRRDMIEEWTRYNRSIFNRGQYRDLGHVSLTL